MDRRAPQQARPANRDARVVVRFTPDEKTAVERLAERHGFGTATLVRAAALNAVGGFSPLLAPAPETTLPQETLDAAEQLRADLRTVGLALNGLAREVNEAANTPGTKSNPNSVLINNPRTVANVVGVLDATAHALCGELRDVEHRGSVLDGVRAQVQLIGVNLRQIERRTMASIPLQDAMRSLSEAQTLLGGVVRQ